jgi:hypothetical protein
MRKPSSFWITLGLAACSNVETRFRAPDAPVAVGAPDGAPSHGSDAGSVEPGADAAQAECDGYEPCGIHPVVMPTGYTAINQVNYDEYGVYGSCTSFEDCGMWDTHFPGNWLNGNTHEPFDPYYNEMGSPFPWSGSRYWIDVLPGKVMYAKLKITTVGELYAYSDGTPETLTERSTNTTTCFQRGPGHMESALIENMGGTGDAGIVTWNISVLPGDMGNSGNASTCTGTGNLVSLSVTSDPVKAATSLDANNKPFYCLLREGETYYLNFMSSGTLGNIDCSVDTCTMGGFALSNFVGSDGSVSPTVQVPCPS